MECPMKKKSYQSLRFIFIFLIIVSLLLCCVGCTVTNIAHAETTEQSETPEQTEPQIPEEPAKKETFWQYLERNKVAILAQVGTILDVVLAILLLVLRRTNKNSVLGLAKSENNFRNSLAELQKYMTQIDAAKASAVDCQTDLQSLREELTTERAYAKAREETLLSTVQGIASILEVLGKGLNLDPAYQVTVHKLWDKISNIDLKELERKEKLDKVNKLLTETVNAVADIKETLPVEQPVEDTTDIKIEQPKKVNWEG